jgi:hypothetical protein
MLIVRVFFVEYGTPDYNIFKCILKVNIETIIVGMLLSIVLHLCGLDNVSIYYSLSATLIWSYRPFTLLLVILYCTDA